MTDLSILIPARNEEWLSRTVADILANMRGNTEIIAVLDGAWAAPPLPVHPRLHILYFPQSIGQRAATNAAARIASGTYVMKVDAHCAFAENFDVTLMERMGNDWTVAPLMRNLHVFDWVCKLCGNAMYQGAYPQKCVKLIRPERRKPAFPDPNHNCPSTEFERTVRWLAKHSPQSTSYCFDSTPHFQYFREFQKRPEGQGDLTETMSLQGSCFMLTRQRYFDLNVCDESFGSWGSQGIEVAVKSWLSGGRVLINHRTWYAHLFRTQDGFGFPYPMSGTQQENARKHARSLFFNNRWEKQIRPLSWLIDKFFPVPGWSDNDIMELRENEKRNPVLLVPDASQTH